MAGTKSFKRQIKDYQKRVDKWLNKESFVADKKYGSEYNTVIKFVVPLLQILGWDFTSKSMEFEYFLRDKGKVRHADIALYAGKSKVPKIIIEVKRIQVDLTSGTKQIFRYLIGSKAMYGITTNGRELMLFCRRFVPKDSKRATRFFSLEYKHFNKWSDVLSVFSKEKIEDGTFDKLTYAFNHKHNDWRKGKKTGDATHDDYELPLEFARQVLRGGI